MSTVTSLSSCMCNAMVNMTRRCNEVADRNTPERKDWGFSFLVTNEIDALRIAYAYRENPYGVRVEHCPNVDRFMITIWNDRAKAMGLDV